MATQERREFPQQCLLLPFPAMKADGNGLEFSPHCLAKRYGFTCPANKILEKATKVRAGPEAGEEGAMLACGLTKILGQKCNTIIFETSSLQKK